MKYIYAIGLFMAGFVSALQLVGLHGYSEHYEYGAGKLVFALIMAVLFAGALIMKGEKG